MSWRFLALLLLSGCAARPPVPGPPAAEPHSAPRPAAAGFRASGWERADRLFRRDRRWVGADDAFSVDLGHGTVLWLFADTVIDPSGRHSRRSASAEMIRNSIGISHGYEPSRASIAFHWVTTGDGRPSAFFQAPDPDWFWPGAGVMLRDRLLIFLMRVRSVPGGLGFEVSDWQALLISNPTAPPTAWQLEWVAASHAARRWIVGSAGVLVEGGFVYAYASHEPSTHDIYLARWTQDDAYAGRLDGLEWWAGAADWVRDSDAEAVPAPVMRDAATEMTVHRDARTRRLLAVQAVGFGPAVVAMRSAAAPPGPWSEPVPLFRPPEYDRPGILIYAGKAHPALRGADLVLTYCTNSARLEDLVGAPDLYYPRFVRLTRGGS